MPAGPGGLPVSRTGGWSRELAGSAGRLQGEVGCRSAGREAGRVSWRAVTDACRARWAAGQQDGWLVA
jgi:hypothetical protein